MVLPLLIMTDKGNRISVALNTRVFSHRMIYVQWPDHKINLALVVIFAIMVVSNLPVPVFIISGLFYR